MINFERIKSRVAAVKKELANGGDLAKLYAENLEKVNKCSVEDDEKYETLCEIEWYLRNEIVEVYMKQNGYRRRPGGGYAKE